MSRASTAYIGEVMQNLGRATIELKEGKYETVIHRLLPYLTRTDIPEGIRKQIVEIYTQAVERLKPRVYEWETEIATGQNRLYIPVPRRYIPVHGGERVRVRLEVLD